MKIDKASILSGIAIVGVIVTAALSTKAGIKARKDIDNELYRREDELNAEPEPLKKKEIVSLVWKNYLPTAASATVTIGCIVMARRISTKEIAALTATCGYLVKNRDQWEQKVKELAGPKFNEIKKDVHHETAKEVYRTIIPDVQDTGYGDTLCKLTTEYFDIWFRSDPMVVQMGLDEFYHRWHNHEYIGLIEFLDMLHLSLKPGMEFLFMDWGWPACCEEACARCNETTNIIIDTDMTEGYIPGFPEETYIIDVITNPIDGYMEF